ncbi:hypothetical protein EJ110_NYTH53547 [Nymphaea thermarum]|nr:hypothetical protein EJ110_NYTH53547 [Nymphaea thermarum]
MGKEEESGEGPRGPTFTDGKNKGKSCKGCLYYSSLLKSNQRNPLCLGVSRGLPHVPSYVIDEYEMEASSESSSLSDFKYACVGYSVYLDKKDNPDGQPGDHTELPYCVGIELLADTHDSNTAGHPSHIPTHKEDAPVFSQPRTHMPQHSIGEEFLNRFTINAGLVAFGVARNLYRVGNYIKDNVDDILYPYRRRPK